MKKSQPKKKEKLNLIFKKATKKDADKILELERLTIRDKTYSCLKNKNEVLKEFENSEIYLIYKDEHLVGSTEFQMKSPQHAYLAGLIIDPRFQGQGIGREAMKFRLSKLKKVKRIDLVTHPDNFKMINLCQSLGFKIEKRIENYYGDGEPRLVMVKKNLV
jgi:ribosomal protein S18 acetylase RimI-like enzyme